MTATNYPESLSNSDAALFEPSSKRNQDICLSIIGIIYGKLEQVGSLLKSLSSRDVCGSSMYNISIIAGGCSYGDLRAHASDIPLMRSCICARVINGDVIYIANFLFAKSDPLWDILRHLMLLMTWLRMCDLKRVKVS